jgi:uncharacterized SAM-binding protein YcdF (DUF218 family)/lysophospholipase L1-like esterase
VGIRSVVRSRPFFGGLLCGVILVFAGGWTINETSLADWLIAPLLLEDSNANADAIVVLGGGVIGDCVPNINSLRRAVHGARLFRAGRAPMVVITGGSGNEGCPVANAIMNFAGELGVPDDRMFLESEARSTRQNAEFTMPLLRAQHVSRVLLVTDRLHMRRAKGSFEHQGLVVEPVSVPIYEGHPDNISMLAAGAREAAALTYYSLRGWMQPMSNNQAVAGPGATGSKSMTALANPAGPLVILGASYAGNWPITTVGGVAVINSGVAGQQTFQFLERFEADVIQGAPRAVLLWGFINNFFSAANLDEAATAIRKDYTQMIAKAKAAGIEPILATEITVRRHEGWIDLATSIAARALGKVSQEDRINGYVMATNQWLADVGRAEGLLVLDFQAALADASGRRRIQYAAEDGSHVTPQGYEALSTYVRPTLARHFGASPDSRQ